MKGYVLEKYGDLIRLLHMLRHLPTPPRAGLLVGPPGTGKTAFAQAYARAIGGEIYAITITPDTEFYDLFYVIETTPAIRYKVPEKLVKAKVIYAEEVTRGRPTILPALNNVIHEGYVTTPHGERISLQPDVVWILSANLPKHDATVSQISPTFLSRMAFVYEMPIEYDVVMTGEEFKLVVEEVLKDVLGVQPKCVDVLMHNQEIRREAAKILRTINEGAVSSRIATKMGQRVVVHLTKHLAVLVGLGYAEYVDNLLPYLVAPFTPPIAKRDSPVELAQLVVAEARPDFSFLKQFDLSTCRFFSNLDNVHSPRGARIMQFAQYGKFGQCGIGVAHSSSVSSSVQTQGGVAQRPIASQQVKSGYANVQSIIAAAVARVSALMEAWGLPPGDEGRQQIKYNIRRLLDLAGINPEEIPGLPVARRLITWKKLLGNVDLKDPVDVAAVMVLADLFFYELHEFMLDKGPLFTRATTEEFAKKSWTGRLVKPYAIFTLQPPTWKYRAGAQELVFLIDKSGSMSTRVGESDNYGIAVAILANLAASAEGATFTIAAFDANVHVVAERVEWPWPHIGALAKASPEGGTCIPCAIEWASRESPDGAAVIIISDFEDFGEVAKPWQSLKWYLAPSAIRNPRYLEYLRNVLDAEVIDVFVR